MLTIEALHSAAALTQVLDGRRLYLMPIEGTPLSELVRNTRAGADAAVINSVGDDRAVDIGTIAYLANAKDAVLGFSQHDKCMDEITDVCVRSVRNHIQFARTHVAPAVADLVERTKQSLAQMTPASLLGMQVIVWSPPAPLAIPSFESSVAKFDRVAFDSPPMSLRCPTITFKEMLELMHTGSKSVDSAIDEWAATKGEEFFNNIWMSVFQITPVSPGQRAKQFKDFVLDKECGLDNSLAIFLMSRKLVEAGPLADTEMNKSAFENAAAALRNQAGAALARGYDEMRLVEKAGQLVRRVVGNNTVIVNERVYKPWIEAGGSNEILFGNLLQPTPNATVQQINDKAAYLKSRWTQHEAYTAAAESTRRFVRIKQALSENFSAQLKAITEGDEAVEANRMNVMKLFNDLIDTLTEPECDDLWCVCLKLVCRARFYKTDAERILSGIERAKQKNPNISVREAAAVSALEYISFWVASQFKVVSA